MSDAKGAPADSFMYDPVIYLYEVTDTSDELPKLYCHAPVSFQLQTSIFRLAFISACMIFQ